MENFIKNIFDIDDEAETLKSSLEQKKSEISKQYSDQMLQIDEHYNSVEQQEKQNLSSRLKEIESQEKLRLEDYVKKAEELRSIFLKKKNLLLEQISNDLL